MATPYIVLPKIERIEAMSSSYGHTTIPTSEGHYET